MAEFFYNGNLENLHEGILQSGLGTGNNDKTFVLTSGGTTVLLNKIKVAVPGAIGDITVQFYNGASVAAGTSINEPVYLASQPDEGYNLYDKKVTTGSLTARLAGRSSGGNKAYYDVNYFY